MAGGLACFGEIFPVKNQFLSPANPPTVDHSRITQPPAIPIARRFSVINPAMARTVFMLRTASESTPL